MKKFIAALFATTLVIFSTATWAATEVTSGNGLKQMGSVSVSGADTFGDLQHELRQKATQEGAGHYKIVAAGGNDRYYGVATLYK